MLEIQDDRFVTQYMYREDGREFPIGYIAIFNGQGEAKRYKKSNPDYMYKDFLHNYKASIDGVTWTDGWSTQSQAIRKLLQHHGKDETWGFYHIIPCPQTFKKDGWRELDYNETYTLPPNEDD